MKTPKRLEPLLEDGVVDEVMRQLMSGKEATVYVVRCGEETRCAKVYKEANKRSFRQSVDYTEGRKVKSSRQARAMAKGSKYGKQAQEEAWQSAEVDALYRLAAAGVSVLCAGIVHGDLSEFNILLSAHGPIIIDLPQAVDAAGNNHAMSMLERDVGNLADFFGQFAPELINTQYGKEIWALYAKGALTPETVLTGKFKQDDKPVDLKSVVRVIDAVREDEAKKQMRLAEAKAALPKPKRF